MAKKKTDNEIVRGVWRRNICYMVLLTTYAPFLNDAKGIRIVFNIEKDGFEKKGKDKIHELLTDWRKERDMTGKQWDYLNYPSKEQPLDAYHKHLNKLKDPDPETPYGKWHARITTLRERYFIPFHFQPYIENFTLTGIIASPYLNHYADSVIESKQKNMTVTSVIMYGNPSPEESEYIVRQLHPIKHLASDGSIQVLPSVEAHQHPKDILFQKFFDVALYANVMELSLAKEDGNDIIDDYTIASKMFPKDSEDTKTTTDEKREANRIKGVRHQAEEWQRMLFEKAPSKVPEVTDSPGK